MFCQILQPCTWYRNQWWLFFMLNNCFIFAFLWLTSSFSIAEVLCLIMFFTKYLIFDLFVEWWLHHFVAFLRFVFLWKWRWVSLFYHCSTSCFPVGLFRDWLFYEQQNLRLNCFGCCMPLLVDVVCCSRCRRCWVSLGVTVKFAHFLWLVLWLWYIMSLTSITYI